MTPDIAQERIEIEKEQARIDGWDNILTASNGTCAKFLKSELNRLANEVRHLYGKIRIDQASALQQLAVLQAEEQCLKKLLLNLTDLQVCKNELDKRREMCNKYALSEEVSEPLARKAD
jgi:hypothetical protein